MPGTDATPAAVRRAFTSKRLQSAWTMMGDPNPADRAAAVEGVTRILDADGLCMRDVLDALLSMPLGPPIARPAGSRQSDLFSQDRTEPSAAPAMRVVSGRDVPERVGGRVIVLDERRGRKGPEMTIAVVGFDARYDPIAARDPATIEALRSAAARGGLSQIVVGRARTARQMPTVERVGMGIAF